MRALVGTAESWITLTITRSLGRRGIKVDCASEAQDALSFHSRYCQDRFHYPSPLSDEEGFVKSVLSLVAEQEYLLPYFTSEVTLLPLSRNRKEIEAYTHLPIPSHEALVLASNKADIIKHAESEGIPCPKTFYPKSQEEAVEHAKEIGYPVVIKPRYGSNARGVTYCKNEAELTVGWGKVNAIFEDPIIQEYIPPGGGAVGLEALFNRDSEVRASFVHRRIHEFPVSGGPSTLRESIRHPRIMELGLKLLSSLKWYGVGMVEFRIDPRNGEPKLMEINPRFWGSLALSVASGIDFPYMLYELVKEGDVKPMNEYRVGIRCRHLLADLRHIRHVLLHGPAPKGASRFETLSSLFLIDKNLRYDVLSISDPKPFIYEIIESLQRIKERQLR